MSGPWEAFAEAPTAPPIGPWSKFSEPSNTGAKEATGPWDAFVSGVQGSSGGLISRGKLPDLVLDPHHAAWYERTLQSAGALVGDFPAMVAGALGGGVTGGAIGSAVAPGPGTVIGGMAGGGAGAMAVPTEIRESLIKSYEHGDAASSADFLGRVGIVIRGLADKDVEKATAKAALVGAATMGAGKLAAPLGRFGVLGAEAGTLSVAPAALDGRLPEPQEFVDAAILLGGLKGAGVVAGRIARIWTKTGIPPEQVIADAQADPTIKEDLVSERREYVGRVPTKEELLAEFPQKEFGLPQEELDAAMERLRATTKRVHEESLADPERLAREAREMGITPEQWAARLRGDDVPPAYVMRAMNENAKAAVPGVKTQEFMDQPFAEVPQAEGEPTKPTHINYNYINTETQVEMALSRMSNLYRNEIQQQRRGAVSNDQTYAEAGAILNRMIGGQDVDVTKMRTSLDTDHSLGARILAKKQLAVGAAENVMRMRDEYVRIGTEEAKLQYMAAIESSASILSNFLGERAEIGRALEILKNTKKGAERAAMLSDLLQKYKADPDKLAIAMGRIDDPGAVLRLSSAVVKASGWDKFIEYWKAGLVSGPWTHAANLSGNTAFMAMRPAIEQVAALMGTVRAGEDKIAMIQPLARVIGNINGAFEVAKMASKIYQLEGATGVIKAAWASGNRSAKAEASMGAIGGTWGKVVRSSFQVLGAEDALFKTLNERGELYSIASRKATNEGLSPMTLEFWNRVGELVSNPTDAEINASKEAGLRLTFNLPLGEKGKAVQNLIRTLKLQWAFPFTQTPTNIAKEMVRMTPFAPIMGEWTAEFSKGGAARDKAIAELAVGSALMTGVFALAKAGIITGSSTGTPGEKNVKEGAGIQPTSVLVNGKYYDISRIQPVGTMVVLAADIANVWDKLGEGENDKAAKVGAVAFANAITNQTMLQGLTMMVNALSEPDRWFPRMAQSYASSMVPFSGLSKQSAEAIDKEQRRIDSIRDAVYGAVPVLRESLLPKINVLTGEPLETKQRVAGQKATQESMDKVLTEAARLGIGVSKAPKNIQVPAPDKKIGKVELTPEQQNIFQSATGAMAHQIMAQLVASPSWENLPDLVKKRIFAKVFTQARKAGAAAAFPADQRIVKAQEIADEVEESLK